MSGRSGSFDDDIDPFFTGDPEQLPELGSITHGDASTFADENPAGRSGIREFEFEGAGGSLELGEFGELGDIEVTPQSKASPPELSKPSFDSPDFAVLDLPAAARSSTENNFTPELDLPMAASSAPDLDLPMAAGSAPDLDLPMAAGSAPDLDLPMAAASASDLDLDLPTPASSATNLDLPMAVGEGGDLPMPIDDVDFGDGLSLDDLPMPADDLPIAADNLPSALDDFPAPVDDFPTPAFDDSALPSAVDNLPAPAIDLPESADVLPTPVDGLNLNLDDSGLPDLPGDAPSAKAPRGVGRSPVGPKDQPRRDIGRYVIYGLVGLIVVGVGGGIAALQMGLFDPDPPPPPPTQTDGGDDGATPTTGDPTERPEGVLAKFDQDTPASYDQAYVLSEDDPVGRAEAALLLHRRYGPDLARLEEAGQLLAPHQSRTEPFVRRVVGLAQLSTGQTDEALATLSELGTDDPRAALYRAWILLERGQTEAAREAAEAAVAKRPNDQAAQLAVLRVRFDANPLDGIAAMRQAAKTSPNHLALQEALMLATWDQGLLEEAAKVGREIQPSTVSAAHKAEFLRQRAGIAMTQGLTGEAMRLLEEALASDANLLAARVDRIELWLRNKDFTSVRADLDLLLRDQASDPLVLKLAARVELEAGRDEDALVHLGALGEAANQDPEAQDILGQSKALLMSVDEAQAAYAAARKLDPLYTPATVHEVDLLIRADLGDQALALLDAQSAALAEASAQDSDRGRDALATVARTRAEVLLARGEVELALTAAEEALASDPSSNDAMLLRARLLRQLGKREAHEEALLELHERTGGFPGLTAPLGEVLLRKGKLDELEKLIGSSLDAPEASREIVLTGASLRLAQDKPDQAEALAQRVLERDPTDPRAHLLLGRALLARGEYARALDEIQSAQTRDGDAEVELWLGQALEYNARAGEARAHYTRSLELEPNNLEAAALLGRLYAYEGAAAKATELLQPVVDQTDAYPYAYLALGLANKDRGKLPLAITNFQRAQELDPTLFEAFYQEGRIHNDQNKHQAAVKALQGGIDNAKDNATERALIDAYRRLGESYAQLGRRPEARGALEEYLRLAPASAAGRREVERLLRDL